MTKKTKSTKDLSVEEIAEAIKMENEMEKKRHKRSFPMFRNVKNKRAAAKRRNVLRERVKHKSKV